MVWFSRIGLVRGFLIGFVFVDVLKMRLLFIGVWDGISVCVILLCVVVVKWVSFVLERFVFVVIMVIVVFWLDSLVLGYVV